MREVLRVDGGGLRKKRGKIMDGKIILEGMERGALEFYSMSE